MEGEFGGEELAFMIGGEVGDVFCEVEEELGDGGGVGTDGDFKEELGDVVDLMNSFSW